MSRFDFAEVRVRVASSSDGALLARLGAETFRDTFAADNSPEDMEAYLAEAFGPAIQAGELVDPHSTFLVAEAEGVPVGYARLRIGTAPAVIEGLNPVEIARFYASKEAMGLGVGARMMSESLALAQRRGCDVVWLDVWERNYRAIAFYGKWGFAEVGEQPFRLGSDVQRDLLMARKISASLTDTINPGRLT
ncbi:MAG: GNAT family N-acetyltransferase [Actinobacteria bacterium]|nr:GNAT family N-acetyltransferase [Actinomycetota bacterium]